MVEMTEIYNRLNNAFDDVHRLVMVTVIISKSKKCVKIFVKT
jgi:hypothetical protein